MSSSMVIFLDSWMDGEKKIAFLSEANRLSHLLGCELYGICFLHPSIDEGLLERYGVAKLFTIEGEDFQEYDFQVFGSALSKALRGVGFDLVLLPHSEVGKELACWVAEAFDRSAVTDCVEIRVRGRRLTCVRRIYADQYEQEVTLPDSPPHFVTMNLGQLDVLEPCFSSTLERVSLKLEPDAPRNTRDLETIVPDFRTVDLAFADLIVGVGAGCLDGHLLGLVEEFCSLIEASFGVTRPVVDEGYFSKERMIGQTGRSVSPQLYLALGISGSPHHVAGIKDAKKVVAVNRDERAPIFGFSDLSFVCDLKEVLPILVEKIRKYKAGGEV